MPVRSERAGNAIRAFGELGWFKIPSVVHPLCGYQQIPYKGWRYKNPRDSTRSLFQRVAAEAPEQLEWIFDSSSKNWLLIPARLSQQNLEASGMSFPEMTQAVREEDQEYCRSTNLDLDRIIEFLERMKPGS